MHNKTVFKRDFILVIIGQIISIFGNQIVRYALPLYLLNQTGSATLFGTIMAISFIPMLLLFPIGGIFADRYNKRNIMVILDFSTSALLFVFCLFIDKMSMVLIVTITMIVLYGIQGAYQPAVQASVPLLVESKYLVKGNSIVNLITSIASMLGPVIGGVLYSAIGLTPILYTSIFCFAASAIIEIFIHIPFEKKIKTGNILTTGIIDMKASFNFILNTRPVLLKVSLIYASVNLLLTSLILIGLPVLITQHLAFEVDTANRLYGYSQGIVGAGAVFGGVLAGMLSKKLRLKKSPLLIIGCALPILVCGVALQMLTNAIVIYIILTIGAGLLVAFSTILQIQVMSCIGILTPEGLIGKVIACVICICMCSNPIGSFLYGIIIEDMGLYIYLLFYIAGISTIVIAIFNRHFFCNIDTLIEMHSQEYNNQ